MHAQWYCRTCNTRIEKADIDDHEDEGHDVKGLLRPERLLSNDPWTVGDGERPPDAGPTNEEFGTPPVEELAGEAADDADEEVTD
jgi:hypothetical protein